MKEFGADSKNAGSNPRLLGEMVEGRETKMFAGKLSSNFLRYFFTCKEQEGTMVSSCAEAAPDEEDTMLFLGAIATKKWRI